MTPDARQRIHHAQRDGYGNARIRITSTQLASTLVLVSVTIVRALTGTLYKYSQDGVQYEYRYGACGRLESVLVRK